MKPAPTIDYIDTAADLDAYAASLAGCSWMAIDTEFLRERTYRPELCLLQIAAAGRITCIDPLALDNIEPLLDVIYDPSVIKVLHAASQDLEIFYWLRGEVPSNLFDTQIAAPLLGHQEQIGYGTLVKEILGVDLEKSHSRADWTRRPLPKKQLDYAADDVIYLSKMYPIMRKKLHSLDRLQWLDQEWLDLTNVDLYLKPAEHMWKKLRQVDKLKGPRLAVAQQLAQWRELTARESNLPRSWLLKDDVLLDLAKQMPESEAELKYIRSLSDSTKRQHGAAMIDIISRAAKTTPEKMIIPAKKAKLTIRQDAALDVLTAVAKSYAEELQINSAVLAPRKSLEDLIRGNRDTKILKGWREPLIGRQICSLIDGEGTIHFADGQLQITG
ncbi:ribonuclease D [Chromatiales bacterium (ex Bugula neritina AB1)]|nr:ribonuclease D [Chromatiales bacterium (ex Bugula neritina AB1)]